MARCSFCGGQFTNAQGVRAHLRHCAAYRGRRATAGLPKTRLSIGRVPIGRPVPEADVSQAEVDSINRAEPRMREAQPRVPTVNTGVFADVRAALDAAEKRRKEAAVEALRQKRRQIIQRVKDRVVGQWSSLHHPISAETKARALAEIERELSARPVDELSEWELVALAEASRDKHYRPVIEAQEEAQRLGEHQREEARRTTEQKATEERARQQREARLSALLEYGAEFASGALQEVDDLDPRDRLAILRRVERDLEEALTGKESERAVEAHVDEILDEELGEAEDDDEYDDDDDYDDDDNDSDDEDSD